MKFNQSVSRAFYRPLVAERPQPPTHQRRLARTEVAFKRDEGISGRCAADLSGQRRAQSQGRGLVA